MVADLVSGLRWPGGFYHGVLPGLALFRPEHLSIRRKTNSFDSRRGDAIVRHDSALVAEVEDAVGLRCHLHVDDNVDLLAVLILEFVSGNGSVWVVDITVHV